MVPVQPNGRGSEALDATQGTGAGTGTAVPAPPPLSPGPAPPPESDGGGRAAGLRAGERASPGFSAVRLRTLKPRVRAPLPPRSLARWVAFRSGNVDCKGNATS